MRLARRGRSTTLAGLVKAGGFVTALFAFATVMNQYHQYLELFSHFRLQYLVIAAILLLLFLLMRSWLYVWLMLATVALNAWFVVPWYLPADEAPHNEGRFKVLLANVFAENNDHYVLRALLDAEQPDIVFLQEIGMGWALTLDTWEDYPHRHIVPRYDYFGIAVLSRLPLDTVEVVGSPPRGFPTLVVGTSIDENAVTFVSTHPMPPMNTANFEARNMQLASVAELVNESDGPKVLIGDLNTTMWSENYQRLVGSTGLENVRTGFGVLPSWPVFLPFAMIPIDHCLVSGELHASDVRLGPDIGSDHRPLIATLQFR
ncbi:MAG: endonuclease/exonuclease/phosphatase family protein [Woeseiaceae bacterium]|nr:endonuclease/exonuclease/phosphatase family protein [Woeseiaceae bacterium]